MAKRFIDTNIFNDEWFMNLSKDGKLFFLYYITQCDHAGILKLNRKLFEFQTGVKNIDTVIKELEDCLITVKENVFFMPKYIKFQYPDFPKSSVKQQASAIKILVELGLFDENLNSYLTVTKELTNSYVNDNVIDIGIDTVKVTECINGKKSKLDSVREFYRAELQKAKEDENYQYLELVHLMFDHENENRNPFNILTALPDQLTYDQFKKLKQKDRENKLKDTVMALENNKNHKNYKSMYLTLNNWLK